MRVANLLVLTLVMMGCNTPAETPDAFVERDAGAADATPDANPDARGPFAPDQHCPGDPGCADTGDDRLYVGAAALEITPIVHFCTGAETDTSTCTETIDVDVDGDSEYDPADGDTFHDWNGNGTFEGVWMAGFGNARGARSIHDPQWARAIALRQNETTFVMVAIDAIGWFSSEMDLVRADVAMDPLGAQIDWISFSATHVHEARDTIGLWGVTTLESGIDPVYMERVRTQVREAVLAAVRALSPANVEYSRFSLRDTVRGVMPYISDIRDPRVYDDEVKMMRFVVDGDGTAPGEGETIATLINMASHPESFDDDNTGLSSDYVHYLRHAIEQGVVGPDGAMEPPLEGPGIAVFFQGPLGGQIGPDRLRCHPTDTQRSTTCTWDGTTLDQAVDREGFVSAIGSQIGYYALRAMRGGMPAMATPVRDMTADLAFRTRRFYVPIENTQYHIGLLSHVFERPTYLWDDQRRISPTNLPSVETLIAVIDIGRAEIITAPGELDPILFLGGLEAPYDYTPPTVPIIAPDNPNPPNLANRPHAPFLRDLARPDADYVFLFGLSEDFLGYFVPEFDYQLADPGPYLNEAPGNHYEETNSVGIHGWPTIRAEMEALLAWHP